MRGVRSLLCGRRPRRRESRPWRRRPVGPGGAPAEAPTAAAPRRSCRASAPELGPTPRPVLRPRPPPVAQPRREPTGRETKRRRTESTRTNPRGTWSAAGTGARVRPDLSLRHAGRAATSPPGDRQCCDRPRSGLTADRMTHRHPGPRTVAARCPPRRVPIRRPCRPQHRSRDLRRCRPPHLSYRSPRLSQHRSTYRRWPPLQPWSPGHGGDVVRNAPPRSQVRPPGRCGGSHRPLPVPWAMVRLGSSAPSAGHRCRNGAPCLSPPRAGRRRSPGVRECVWAYVGLRRSAESCADKEAIASVA